MSLRVGIVGLPNVGKSTLFNALLKKRVALSANYPFATIEPNIGVVEVPDPRLLELAELIKDEENLPAGRQGMTSLPPLVPAVVEFVDIAGLVKGASEGAGLGNKFLSHIREVDAVVHVLRDFNDTNIIREGSISPDEDRSTIETELALSDLQVLEKLIVAAEKEGKVSKDPLDERKLAILKTIQENLSSGKVLGHYQIGDERIAKWFKTLPLLTTKPILYVFNVSEDSYGVILNEVKNLKESNDQILRYAQDDSVVICARLEEELADYTEEERSDYLKEMGILETGLDRLIKKAYSILGLISFLTAGEKEVRAWTVEKGSLGPKAAGVIHTDFEKKYIRAQVIEYQKLIEVGSYKAAKDRGLLRMEGKEYEVKDGDVIEFFIGS